MRYPASEKLEIIRLVEQYHLGVGSTLVYRTRFLGHKFVSRGGPD